LFSGFPMIVSKDPEKLLALIRISDTFFPLGSYAMSQGMEQLVQDGFLAHESISDILKVYLKKVWNTTDLRIFHLGLDAAHKKDLAKLCELDRICYVSKIAEEARLATVRMGTGLLGASSTSFAEESLIARFRALVRSGDCLGTYPISLAVASVEMQLGELGALSLVYVNVMEIIASLVRLGEIDYVRAQEILQETISNIEIEGLKPLEDISQSFPFIDIASMRHERNDERMFAT
jgi:urease accessory protein